MSTDNHRGQNTPAGFQIGARAPGLLRMSCFLISVLILQINTTRETGGKDDRQPQRTERPQPSPWPTQVGLIPRAGNSPQGAGAVDNRPGLVACGDDPLRSAGDSPREVTEDIINYHLSYRDCKVSELY